MNTPENNFSNGDGKEDFVQNLSPEDQQKWEESMKIFEKALADIEGGFRDYSFFQNERVSEAYETLCELSEKTNDQK